MKNYFLTAVLFTLLSAGVLAQKPNPKELDYEEDFPLQPGSRDVPVFVNVHSHPKTSFSCADKQAGQYYADPETKCAVYYVCIQNERGSLSPQSFACPNGTLFSQSTRVCASHEMVYCQHSERYYDAVHGNIDSKGKEDQYKSSPLQPWKKPQSSRPQASDSQPTPVQPQPRPQTQPQARPQPQSRLQPSRTQPQPTPVAPLPAAPTPQNSRRSQFSPPVVSTPASAPAPASAPGGLPEYEYEYVDYGLPNDTNQGKPASVAVNPPIRTKRSNPTRRKGELPSPFDFFSVPHIITAFKCEDKVPGIAYADTETDCHMFHVCIPFSKGKLRDYQLYCETNKAYNQETGSCEPKEEVNCARSQKYFVYNKWFRPQESRKDSWKKYIKKNAKKSS